MTIRMATEKDAGTIASIQVKTWQSVYRGQMPDNYLDKLSVKEKTASWKDQLRNPTAGVFTCVIEKSGRIIGWSKFGINRDEDATGKIGEIYVIYLDTDYLRQGIGTKLMEYVLGKLRQEKYQQVTLWVLDTNTNSRRFYEKNGFVADGLTKTVKRDGFDLHETRYKCIIP